MTWPKPTLLLLAILSSAVAGQEDPWSRRLDESPRHHEWVALEKGDRTVHAFVVYPEVDGPAPGIVVIHENRGLDDWARALADQLAEAGCLVIAVDLLSGSGPDGGRSSSFESTDAAREAIYALPPEQVRADLDLAIDYLLGQDACSGKVAVAGFCWGGQQTFLHATTRDDLAAAFVFYGRPPDDEAMAGIECPVFGFYGENDARITSTLPATRARMTELGKRFEPVVYDGARHAFMRRGELEGDDAASDRLARQRAWTRWMELLEAHCR